MTLEEAGAAYKAMRVDFARSEQRQPEYLATNPKGRVPALATDGGILTETPAILAFIAQSFPRAALAPLDDPFAFTQVQAFNSYLCSTVHVVMFDRARGPCAPCPRQALGRRPDGHRRDESVRLRRPSAPVST
jgi:glutathione S-transferase